MELRRWKQGVVLVGGLLLVLSLAGVGPAEAFKVDVSDDLKISSDVTLTYGAAWRTSDANKNLLSNINADDGNRNFQKWDMINNRIGASIDFDANYKKDFGIFVRPRGFLDYAYLGKNANDSPATNNNGPANGGPLDSNNDFMNETVDLHGRKFEILDAFAYSKFTPGGHETVLRVGRQVVNWGESVFLAGGLNRLGHQPRRYHPIQRAGRGGQGHPAAGGPGLLLLQGGGRRHPRGFLPVGVGEESAGRSRLVLQRPPRHGWRGRRRASRPLAVRPGPLRDG